MTEQTKAPLMFRSESKIKQAEREIEELLAEGAPKEEPKEEVVEKLPEAVGAEEKTFQKRYADLRRHQQAQQKLLEDKIEELENQLNSSTSKVVGMPKTRDEIEAWVKAYPDVAGIVRGLARDESQQVENKVDLRLRKVEEMEERLEQEKAEAELKRLHPDFDQIRDTDAFHEWAETQPKWIQKALYEEPDVAAAARAIDLYKMDNKIVTKSPDKNAAMAVNTRNRVTPQDDEKSSWYKESQINKMSDKEFSEKSEEIEKAMREGKFVYDMSGKAR